jgi:N-acetylglutamate synthase
MSGDGSEQIVSALSAAMDEVLRLVPGSSMRSGDGYRLHICPLVPIPLFCGVVVTDPGFDADIAHELPHVVEEVEAAGVPISVVLPGGSAPSVQEAAMRLGVTEREAQLAMLVHEPPPARRSVSGVRIDEARSPGELREATELCAAGFGMPPAACEPLYTPAFAEHPGIRIYVGRMEGAPVTTGVGVLAGGALGVFSVATPPEHRRRGYAGDLVSRALADGFADGARFAYLHASATGVGAYEAAGFQPAGEQVVLTRPGSA